MNDTLVTPVKKTITKITLHLSREAAAKAGRARLHNKEDKEITTIDQAENYPGPVFKVGECNCAALEFCDTETDKIVTVKYRDGSESDFLFPNRTVDRAMVERQPENLIIDQKLKMMPLWPMATGSVFLIE